MRLKQNLIALILCIGSINIAYTQRIKSSSPPSAAQLQERIFLSTDRTLYFSGEKILFKATRILPDLNPDTLFSNVLYLELYDQKNNPIIQKKEQIIKGLSSGSLEIPEDIITGNYFLRGYTQYMRNFSPGIFYTSQITIINPELPAKEKINTAKLLSDSTSSSLPQKIEIVLDKKVFPPRSLISMGFKSAVFANISVSVVKKGSYEENKMGINSCCVSSTSLDTISLRWIPDIRAVSLAGKVIDKQTGKPISDVLVFVSIIDSERQFHAVRSNKNGEFILSLPNLNENHKIYICAQKQDNSNAVVLINNDFSTAYIKPDYTAEVMDSIKMNLFNEMYLNYQVSQNFRTEMTEQKKYFDTLRNPFGSNPQIVVFKDFVDLKEMEFEFNEIVPYTHVKRNRKGGKITVIEKNTQRVFEHPLILFDGIPYENDSAILSLPTTKIYSIGVINGPVIYGGQVLYGIINIESVDGNLGAVHLPDNLVSIDYTTFSPLKKQLFTEYKLNSPDSRKPDFRNTMYWNPSVDLNDKPASVQFYSSDCTGDYDIIVRGIDEDGKQVFATKTIRIEDIKR